MSKEFIEGRMAADQLEEAARQVEQIKSLVDSEIQENVSEKYIDQLCKNGYKGNDAFLNWVHTIFKEDNFRGFFKYLRYPLASSRLVKEEIEPSLQRVFYSEDGFSYYVIGEDEIYNPEELNKQTFEASLFEDILYNFNDVIVHDVANVNDPIRYNVPIDKVVAINADHNCIKQIAFHAERVGENGETVKGYLYIDDTAYIFYDKEFTYEPIEVLHDLEECPACFVSPKPFTNKNPIVRASIFSRVRTDLEEYVFLKTIQRMTDPNGAVPVTVKFKTESEEQDADSEGTGTLGFGMDARQLVSDGHAKKDNESGLQAGSVTELPVLRDNNGNIITDLVSTYFQFYRTPVDSLEYLDGRITAIEGKIMNVLVGGHDEANEEAKNELQVSKSYAGMQNKLRRLGEMMATTQQCSDRFMLGLAHGIDRVYVERSYGHDFFIETQDQLYQLLTLAPNAIEKQSILKRLAANRGRNNKARMEREMILYQLLPFSTDKDFNVALANQVVSHVDKQLYLRFNYFINIFEAQYGELTTFFEALGELERGQKMNLIYQLLIEIVNTYGTEEVQQSENNSPSNI